MTISSTIRTAGPFTGNGVADTFAFPFKVFDASEITVYKTVLATSAVTTLALTTDYTVTLNDNQDGNPGGDITLVAGALPATEQILIVSAILNTQPILITNQSGFYPSVINDGLDRAAAQVQQVKDQSDRSIRFPDTELGTSAILPAITQRAGQTLGFDVNGNVTVAGTFPSLVYYGPGNDPATRPNGLARQIGDLHFNTASNTMKVFDGSSWIAFNSAVTDGVRNHVTISGGGSVFTVTGFSTIAAQATFTGGLLSRPNAAAPTSTVAIGPNAGNSFDALCFSNVAIGNGAAQNVVGGSSNIGQGNTAVGAAAGSAMAGVQHNTVIGHNAGNRVSTGNGNTCVGSWAGRNITTGLGNTLIGGAAGGDFTNSLTGSHNIVIGGNSIQSGYGPGRTLGSGSANIIIGHPSSDVAATTDTNSIVISGAGATGLGSNTTAIGSTATVLCRFRGTSSSVLRIDGNTIGISNARTPSSPTATGTAGDVCWDSNHVYVCVATNSWKRVAISASGW